MRRVVVHCDAFGFAIPETQRPQNGIDQPFRRPAGLGILRRTRPREFYFAVRSKDAAIRRNLNDLGGAGSDVRKRHGLREGRPQRVGTPLHRPVKKSKIERDGCLGDCNYFLGTDVGKRRVVRVDAMNRHAFGRRMRGFGEGRPPLTKGVVSQAAPIDRTQHNGFFGAENDNADGFQGIVHAADRLDPAAAEWMPERRRHVRAEWCEKVTWHRIIRNARRLSHRRSRLQDSIRPRAMGPIPHGDGGK